MRRLLARSKYPLRGLLKIGILCEEDIRHELLRIAVDEREPGALHLDHDPVSFLEHVVVGRESDLVMLYRIRRNRLRLFKTIAITSAEDVARDHKFVSAHCRIS